jgi:histidyl-tRNA synthetase
MLERLLADERLVANKSAKAGLDEMSLLFDYLDAYGITSKVRLLIRLPCCH